MQRLDSFSRQSTKTNQHTCTNCCCLKDLFTSPSAEVLKEFNEINCLAQLDSFLADPAVQSIYTADRELSSRLETLKSSLQTLDGLEKRIIAQISPDDQFRIACRGQAWML